MGRPSLYTQELASEICRRLAEGESLRAICKEDGMPDITTVMDWRRDDREGFSQQYAHAREAQAEAFGDELFEIVDDASNDWMEINDKDGKCIGWKINGDHVQRSRLRFDARRWWMSKVLPQRYGEKVSVEQTGKNGGPVEYRVVTDV